MPVSIGVDVAALSSRFDDELSSIESAEIQRQIRSIELIASESHAFKGVLSCLGSPAFDSKYSEGKIGARYYGGNQIVDKLESLCQKRALELFCLSEDKWAVNVQCLSGATANFTVFSALAGPGGKIMGMNLVDGGHLSHGHSASYTSKFFQAKSYKVDHTTYLIDYEQLERDVLEFKPKFLIAGISAYSRNLDYSRFRDIADKVGAILMADMAHVSGLVAAGQVSQSPFEFAHVVTTTTHKTLRGPRGAMIFTRKDGEYLNMSNEVSKAHFPGLTGGPHNNKIYALAHALGEAAKPEFQSYAKQVIKNAQKMAKEFIANGFNVLSGGTDNHMIIVDVAKWAPKPIFTGAHVQILCDAVEISLNMNSVPGDLSPFNPSGIRIGTPKVTIRGCQESEMIYIVSQLIKAIKLSYQIAEKAANERPEFVLKSGKVSKDGFKEFMLKHFNEDIEKLKAENNSFISKYEIYSSCGY